MKKALLSLFTFAIFLGGVKAQETQTDTISLGPAYTQQVWYSMENGFVHAADKSEWHLAFEMSGFGSTIRINGSIGLQLWLYPEPGIEDWETLDTFGLEFWDELIDSEEDWSLGSFTQAGDPNDDFDLGWGTYSIVTHQIVGDRLFVLKTSENVYYKIWIERLAMGTYTFHIANLEDGVESTFEIPKAPYNNKNFVYFSLDIMDILDREPPKSEWDLVFTQYVTLLPAPYVVSGVLQNIGVQAAQIYPVADVNNFTLETEPNWQDPINTIGFDWKEFNLGTFSWTLQDSLIYIVKDLKNQWWSLRFTGFGGSANGNFIFEKSLLDQSTSTREQSPETHFRVYPNPASDFIHVETREIGSGIIHLWDIHGRIVASQPTNQETTRIDTHRLSPGTYLLQYQSTTSQAAQRVVIK